MEYTMLTATQLIEQRIVKDKNEKLDEYFHEMDNLLDGITFSELIDTVASNERVIDQHSVTKTWKELLRTKMRDAEYELKKNMKQIIQAATSGY